MASLVPGAKSPRCQPDLDDALLFFADSTVRPCASMIPLDVLPKCTIAPLHHCARICPHVHTRLNSHHCTPCTISPFHHCTSLPSYAMQSMLCKASYACFPFLALAVSLGGMALSSFANFMPFTCFGFFFKALRYAIKVPVKVSGAASTAAGAQSP